MSSAEQSWKEQFAAAGIELPVEDSVARRLSLVDSTRADLFDACTGYAQARSRDYTGFRITNAAAYHAKMFSLLLETVERTDDDPVEHAQMATTLLIGEDTLRVQRLNEILGASVLKPLRFELDGRDEDLRDQMRIRPAKEIKGQISRQLSSIHTDTLTIDTMRFINLVIHRQR